MSKGFLQPSARGRREPTSNEKDNGLIVNPPRMNEIGGNQNKAHHKNKMTLRSPGSTVRKGSF